jgi:geranylgeranylglycerol-phosphate geranylgeranyltransferase
MTLNRKIRGAVTLFRLDLSGAAGMCVLLGEFLALGAVPPLSALWQGFICGFFLASSANIANDYFDLEVDRINAPHRPLPAGLLSRPEALALAVVAALIGLAAAAALGWLALTLGVILWIVGVLYNWKLKAAGLWGNLMVSICVGMTFIVGGVGVGQPWNKIVWTFGLMAFFLDLAEEIAGDALDAEGDLKRGSKSIAIVMGKPFALRISGFLLLLVVGFSYIPVAGGWLGVSYLVIMSLTDLLILFFTLKLLRHRTTQEGRRAMRGIYLGASLGFLAFLVGLFVAV